jgi:regulator of protease activity HflC (stomatin/prohibitin superfamily)
MEQNRTKLTIVDLLALLAAAGVGFAIARTSQSFTAYIVLPFLALGFVVSAVSYFHMRLVEREKSEQLEYDELTKTPSASALFNKGETESLPARRSRQQFEKFFLPGVTILLLLGEAVGVFFLWRWLTKSPGAPVQEPMLALVLFALFALVLFMLGRYSIALTKFEGQRLLRPVASFVLANAYLCAAVSITIVFVYAGFPQIDRYVARALVILLGLVAVETLLTLLLDVYRPRVRGKEVRLLHESRLMGLLAQPESLFTTAAHALDYQFGFAVSQTRFFQILQKQLAWIIAAQVIILVLSTTMVVIETGEEALLERFGKPVAARAIVGPGFHWKLPWPIDKIHRYRTEQIQEFEVGLAKEEGAEEKGDTVLWTVSHTKEEFNLLVASRETGAMTNADARKSPPVNLLSVGIPVQFQVTNLSAWAYNNAQPDQLLEKLATREVVRFLVSADLHEIMSTGRDAAAEQLRQRIQTAANERSLGARIVFVGLQDIHPPVAVAGAYEKVVGSLQTREAKILSAKAQATQTNSLATALAYRTVRDAEADRDRTKSLALARAASFTNQLPAYRAAPSVYSERAYLQALARNAANTRKYVIGTSNTEDVILFNLEDKVRTDLLDVPLPPAAKGK